MRVLLVLALVACGSDHKQPPGDGSGSGSGSDAAGDGSNVDADLSCTGVSMTVPTLHGATVVTGLDQPLYVTQPPGSTDLYVVEKPGKIVIVRGGAIVAPAFLDVTAEVDIPDSSSEGGLIGLAFAPSYATSGRYWVYMSVAADHAMHVREYHRSAGNPDVSDATPAVETLIIPGSCCYNELGGTVLYGPDGKLWVGTGDGGTGDTGATSAQDLSSRHGKMLRIDPDNPTVAPSDNLGGGADPYIWDYGLRNPYRFSFDRATHQVYIADAGNTKEEEVDIETPAMGHQDYGWNRMEGDTCATTSPCPPPGTLPQYTRPHEASFSVIIGGNVYRGSALPQLKGRYVFAIYALAGSVLSFVYCGGQVMSQVDMTNSFADTAYITGFGEDLAGELYYTTGGGALYQIVPN
jgi:glucose/arabinose dehydrogenase